VKWKAVSHLSLYSGTVGITKIHDELTGARVVGCLATSAVNRTKSGIS
jgi:hypothetical protein